MKKNVLIAIIVTVFCMHAMAQDLRKYEKSGGYKLSVKEGVLSKTDKLKSNYLYSDTAGYDFHTHHSTGINVPFGSITDNSGNVYVTGTSSDFESTRGNFVTIKVNSDGNMAWEKREPGTKYVAEIGMEVALASDENPISTGMVWNGHDMDLQTIKYNASNGDIIWQHTYQGDADGLDVPSAITVAADGSILIAGITYSGPNITWLILKYNSDGTLLWSKTTNNPLPDSWIEPTAIFCDLAGNIGVTGYNGNSEYWSCYYTEIYTAEGTLIWADLYEDENLLNVNSLARSITADDMGNWYITGTLDTHSPVMRTIKYSPNGSIEWIDSNIMTEEFSEGFYVLTGPDDKIYAGGRHFGNWIDDGWVLISFNEDGSREWSNMSNDLIDVRPIQMTLDQSGNPVIAGWGSDPETWNNIINGVKYNPQGEIIGEISYLQTSSEFGGFNEFMKIDMDNSDNAYLTFVAYYTNLGSVFEVMKLPFSTGTMEWDYLYSNKNASRTELLTAWTDGLNNTYVTARFDSITDNYLLTTYIVVKYNQSGKIEWEKQFNEFNDNASNGIQARVTEAGDVIVYLIPNFGEPIKLKKYNTSGSLLWETELVTNNGSFQTFFLDQTGNIYLAGNAFENESDPFGKFAVIKLSENGEEQWRRFAVREGSDDELFSLDEGVADNEGNTYYTGAAGTGGWFEQAIDVVALKYNPAGELQWVKSFPQEGYNTSGRFVLVNKAGDIYINGHREDKITFAQQMIVMKLNPDGTENWSAIFEDPGRRVMSYKLVQLSTGEIIVSGFSVVDGLNNKVILAKFDDLGNFIDVTTTDYDRFFNDMYLDAADNLMVLNQVAASPYPFKPYYSTGPMPIAGLFTLHPDGTSEEELSYGPDMSDYFPAMLVPLNDGRLLIAGTISNEFSMFQGLYFFEDEHVVSTNDHDLSEYNFVGQNIPNPADANTVIPVYLDKQTMVTIKIYDMTGRIINTAFSSVINLGNHMINISTSGLKQGVYLYEVVAGKQRQSYRMMVK